MKKVEVSDGAVRVGKVEDSPARTVVLQSRIGGNRVVDMLSGEQLPRICERPLPVILSDGEAGARDRMPAET